MWTRLIVWKPCKRCGNNHNPREICSHCGGHGMTYAGDGISDCQDCGGSGEEWPPRCQCGAYRAAIYCALLSGTDLEYLS